MSGNLARGFLDDICANIDDDTPRLVYADWLDENGQEARAEFIRVQIERMRLPEWDIAQVRLRHREAELLRRHGMQWLAEMPKVNGVTWAGFRRGLVGVAKFASFAAIRAGATRCWAATPLEAALAPWPRAAEKAETLPPITGLRELTIDAMVLERNSVARLANAPLLSTLRVLDISNRSLEVAAFRRLVASPYLARVMALRVPNNSLGDAAITALTESSSLPYLEELDFSNYDAYGGYGDDSSIGMAGLAALAGWPGLARLRSVALSRNVFGRDGLASLLRSTHVVGLKRLVLRGVGLSARGLQEFREARPGLLLDALDLSENNIGGPGGASNLARSECLRELKDLKLARCELTGPNNHKLTGAAFVGTLRRLDVDDNYFGPQALELLLDKRPTFLHTLHARNNELGDQGAKHLATSPASDGLLNLDLAGNGMTDRAAQALMKSKFLRGLLVLRLGGNRFKNATCAELADSPLAKRLLELDLEDD
jgi:uncharacterized protein (TIGR02996 family)